MQTFFTLNASFDVFNASFSVASGAVIGSVFMECDVDATPFNSFLLILFEDDGGNTTSVFNKSMRGMHNDSRLLRTTGFCAGCARFFDGK